MQTRVLEDFYKLRRALTSVGAAASLMRSSWRALQLHKVAEVRSPGRLLEPERDIVVPEQIPVQVCVKTTRIS